MQAERHNIEFIKTERGDKHGFFLDPSLNGICQYPLVMSNVEMKLADPSLSSSSSTLGIGYASNSLTAFRRRKSTHNSSEPSFLVTMTSGEAHSLVEGRIKPKCSMSSISFRTRSRYAC